MAYAIFKSGGKQYRAFPGEFVNVDKLDTEVGGTFTFSEVIFFGDGTDIKTGADTNGLTVTAEVISQFKAPKVIAYKYRRRKGYHRTVGHRSKLTRVKITSIGA